jgi:hypothetical protein
MVLYPAPAVFSLVACILWGIGVAYVLRVAINWLQPGIILKVIGFGAGAYVSDANYGLYKEDTIPSDKTRRHLVVSVVPLLTFIIASLFLTYR